MPSNPGRRRRQAQQARKRAGKATIERVSLESCSPMDRVDDGGSDSPAGTPAVVPYRILTHVREHTTTSDRSSPYTRRGLESGGGKDAAERGKGAKEESSSAEEVNDEGSVNPTEQSTVPTRPAFEAWSKQVPSQACHEEAQASPEGDHAHLLDPEAGPVQSNPESFLTFPFEIRPQTAPYSVGQHKRAPFPDASSCADALVGKIAATTVPSTAPTLLCMVASGAAFFLSPQQPALSVPPPERASSSLVADSPSSGPCRPVMTYDQQRCVRPRTQPTASFGQNFNRYISHGPSPCIDHPKWVPHSLQPQKPSLPLQNNTRVSIPPRFEPVFGATPASTTPLTNGDTLTNSTAAQDVTLASTQALSLHTLSSSADSSIAYPQSPLYPFRSVWPEYRSHERSKPLPKPTWALGHAWSNGLPLPLSANAEERSRSIYDSSQTGRYQPVIISPALVEDSQANLTNDPAIIEAKMRPPSLPMRRTDTAAQLFELAVRAEEERIAEARTKAELKAHLHSLTKTTSQEYGDKKAIQEPVGPEKASSETHSRKLFDAKSARKKEERRERISEGSDDWWEGETLPDDDWEFVEWPPMSGLIWKSSGLDRLVLGLGDAED